MRKGYELLLILSALAFGVAGTLYWLILTEDMARFQRAAVAISFFAILLSLASGLLRRRANG